MDWRGRTDGQICGICFLLLLLSFLLPTFLWVRDGWCQKTERNSSFSTCELFSQSNHFGNHLVLLYFEIKGGDSFSVKTYFTQSCNEVLVTSKTEHKKVTKNNSRKDIMCPSLFQPPQFFLCRCPAIELHSHSRSAHWSNHLKRLSETAHRSWEQHHLYTLYNHHAVTFKGIKRN